MAAEDILLIQTGGTIDKDYPKRNLGYSFEICESAALRILRRHNLKHKVRCVPLCKKDSQEITLEDRKNMLDTCLSAAENRILITHGTDTMIESAKFLSENQREKQIVFTGSFLPETFKSSDAEFNIGFALGVLLSLYKPCVVIAMNGQTFSPGEVVKDAVSGDFRKV